MRFPLPPQRGRPRPEVKNWLRERKLHSAHCPACGQYNTVIKPVLYTDFEQGLWIECLPEEQRPNFRDHERAARDTFAASMQSPQHPRAVRAMARSMRVQVAFGYEELREKLICADEGIDDCVLEVLKLQLIIAHRELREAFVDVLLLEEATESELSFGFYGGQG